MRIKLLLSVVTMLVFLFAAVFTPIALQEMGQGHEMSGGVSHCPFMLGETALCQMNVFEHISSWQAMFTALPADVLLSVMLLLVLALSWVWLRHLFDSPYILEQQSRFLYPSNTRAPSLAALLLGNVISPRAP